MSSMEREAGGSVKKPTVSTTRCVGCLDRDKKRSCFIPSEIFDPLDTSRTHEASVARDHYSGIIAAMRRALTRLYSIAFGYTFPNSNIANFWHNAVSYAEKGMPRNANGARCCFLDYALGTTCPRYEQSTRSRPRPGKKIWKTIWQLAGGVALKPYCEGMEWEKK